MGSFSGLISMLSLIALATINIGDKTPSFIDGTQWIKGSAPAFENSITIVEVWKTTCGICKGQIPHLSSLQKAYGNRISIVALNSEPIDVLNQFMKEHNDEILYTVGHVSKEVMSQFMEGSPGVPYCYIIDKKGNILWKCHAAAIEEVLDRILSGSADIENLKKIAALEKALDDALETNKTESINQAVKDLLAYDPGNPQALEVGVNVAKYDEEPGLIKAMFDSIPISDLTAYNANKFAVMLISDSDFSYRYPEAAIRFADYALKKQPENSEYINTYARLFYCLGDLEKAIVWQKKALKLDPDNKTYQDNLNYYLLLKKLRPGINAK